MAWKWSLAHLKDWFYHLYTWICPNMGNQLWPESILCENDQIHRRIPMCWHGQRHLGHCLQIWHCVWILSWSAHAYRWIRKYNILASLLLLACVSPGTCRCRIRPPTPSGLWARNHWIPSKAQINSHCCWCSRWWILTGKPWWMEKRRIEWCWQDRWPWICSSIKKNAEKVSLWGSELCVLMDKCCMCWSPEDFTVLWEKKASLQINI